MAARDFVIVVLDTNPKRWPSVAQLVRAGVPVKIAERYRHARWDMTAGLKRRVRENKN